MKVLLPLWKASSRIAAPNAVRTPPPRLSPQVGGKSGYSAKNFIRAIAHTRSPDAKVYTVDIFPVPKQGDNHVVLTKNASLISAADVENKHIDLLFFDCHEIGAQIDLYGQLQKAGLLTDETARVPPQYTQGPFPCCPQPTAPADAFHPTLQVIVVHDTNLYYYPQPDGTVLARAHQARGVSVCVARHISRSRARASPSPVEAHPSALRAARTQPAIRRRWSVRW